MIHNSLRVSRRLSSPHKAAASGVEEEEEEEETSRWRINHGICHRNRVLCVTLASLFAWPQAGVDEHVGLGGRGLGVGAQIGAQRHYRAPHKAWFIHKYQRIAISQRCHHFTVEATPPPHPHAHLPLLLKAR